MRRILYPLIAIFLVSCASKQAEVEIAEPDTALQTVVLEESAEPEQWLEVDFSALKETSVSAFNHGTLSFQLQDMLPMLSSKSGYAQKWDFIFHTDPYKVRLKFEFSNLAFSKNEAKISGYIKKYENDEVTEDQNIRETFKAGDWKARKNSLNLDFGGKYQLRFEDNHFYIHAQVDVYEVEAIVKPNFWKPKTGTVYFGQNTEKYFKYSILTHGKNIQRAVVIKEGHEINLEGQAYAHHYATNIPIYEMVKEVQDFRKLDHELVLEYRYFVPGAQYEERPFGYVFASYEGEEVFSSTNIQRTVSRYWIDDDNYGYNVPQYQRIEASEDGNAWTMDPIKVNVVPDDPYANLSTFQRNVAMRVARPIEYSMKGNYIIKIVRDQWEAHVPIDGSFSATLFE